MNEFPSVEDIDAARAARKREPEHEATPHEAEAQPHVEGGRVRVFSADGQPGTVPAAKLQRFLAGGGRLETHEERAERIGGGAGAAFGTKLAGAAISTAMAPTKLATYLGSRVLGTEDPLADVSGGLALERLGISREVQEAREEAHPTASKVGEFAGIGLVGAGLGGVVNPLGAAVGRGLGLGAEAAGVGAHAAHTVAHVGGEIVGGVLEGAALGASGASEHAWIKNEKLTSEHAMHSIMEYALWGGATVAGFKALEAGGSALAKFIKRRGAEEVAPALERAGAHAEGVLGAVDDAAAPGLLDAPPKQGLLAKGREFISGYGDSEAVKAVFRGDQRALKNAGIGLGRTDVKEATSRLGKLLNESGIVGGSDSAMLKKAAALRDAMGPKVGKIVEAVDTAGVLPEAGAWVGRVEALARKIQSKAASPEAESAAKYLLRETEALRGEAAQGTLTYSRLRQFKLDFQENVSFTKEAPKALDRAKHELYAITEQEIEKGVARLDQSTGSGILREYLKAKELYGVAQDALPALAKRVGQRANANMTLGLTGNVLGAGSMVATAMGHPEALLVPFASKIIRERGHGMAAVLAKKIAGESVSVSAAPAAAGHLPAYLSSIVAQNEQRIQKSITGFLSQYEEKAIGGAVKAVFTKVPKETIAERLKAAGGDLAREQYAHHAAEVAELTGSPDVAQHRIQKALGHTLASHAPQLYGAMAAQAGGVAMFLKSKLPHPGMDPNNLTPQVKKTPPVSDVALATYRQYYEGATDPLSILDDMHTGRVSDQKIEAVKTLWPATYESIRRTFFAELADMKEPLPYQKALLFDRMFQANGAIANGMKPESLAAMQQAASYMQEQQQARHAGPSATNPLAKSSAPRTEALAMR